MRCCLSFAAAAAMLFSSGAAWAQPSAAAPPAAKFKSSVLTTPIPAPPPKRELRGVWIATVENIDWPSRRNLTPEQQRQEYVRMLDQQQRTGINAVFVQVRPASDAFYQSSLEPWSKWLTGQQGKEPGWDPLPFLIEEAHKRNMEFHAWFNPYRASTDTTSARLAPNHPYRQHPEWFFRYSGKLLYNPGLPEVRNYITKVIMDVVRRYDIDGVHFDDYFYPYPDPGQVIHDERAYAQFNDQGLSVPDWRRRNVNQLVQQMHDSIDSEKKWVKFGISPFGVWMNQVNHPDGSDTKAFQGHTGLYADAREWLRQGWVDYVLPQLYWSTNFKLASYATLIEWWSRNRYDRHLYIGHGAYRMFESTKSDTTWRNPGELPKQVRLNRSYPTDISGSVFFSAKSVLNNPLKTTDSLRENLFRYPALLPTMPWKDAVPPRTPQGLTLVRAGGPVTLTWHPGPAAADGDSAHAFVVYRFARGEQPTPDNPRHILLIQPRAGRNSLAFIDTTAQAGIDYAYYITAIDRLHNESGPTRVTTLGSAAGPVVAQTAPEPAAAPPAAPAPPVATVPPAVTEKPGTTKVTSSAGNVTIKTKTKTKKRGFFGRLFGR
ncbi:glycoside hydrolase family 10 protein [Hymenobacter latericus]|uniref:glycoside hydrolase family 10 protein n=1 Tax=Hymenobacter sp. YIM 151858-1 TaxID=2987688 RepID=UPI002225C059|nr:family 10 glycosylhydrolase [Hymenobacter sp. YIM 151858-1]UYZ59379.1 family 10 glycosylhydrolase [Hymenobacter sp. YIM 151858-1]